MTESVKSVAIAHRDALVGRALAEMLGGMQFKVSVSVSTYEDLKQAVERQQVRLMLVDVNLPSLTPTRVADLKGFAPVAVIGQPTEGREFLHAGAVGLLSGGLDEEHFKKSLELLLEGDLVVSGDLVPEGLSVASSEEPPQHEELSEREREVLELVARGATNREIAEELIVTEHTVKVHLRHILEKLNLRNRQQVAAYAVQNGLATGALPDQPG